MSITHNEPLSAYINGDYQAAHQLYLKFTNQAKENYQAIVKKNATTTINNNNNSSCDAVSIDAAKCDYARAVLEHSHLLLSILYVIMNGFKTLSKEDEWHYLPLFAQHNISRFDQFNSQQLTPIQLTPIQCFTFLDEYLLLVPTLCSAKDSKHYPTAFHPGQYSFLAQATPQQLTQVTQYFMLLTTLTRLYHYMYFTRQLTNIAATGIKSASIEPFHLPSDQLIPAKNKLSSYTLLELLLTTSQTSTRILLTKARIVLEETQLSTISSSSLPSRSKLQLDPIPTTATDTLLPWQDLSNLSQISILCEHIHSHIQTIIGFITKSLSSPISMLSKLVCTSFLLDEAIAQFISPLQQPIKQHTIIYILKLFAHYNYYSELTSMFLLLFQSQQQQKQQQHSPTSIPPLSQYSLPPIPDPFNVNHNNLFSSQILQTTNGILSLAFVLQPVSVIFTQLHYILRHHLPFIASSIEYNMSTSYSNTIILGQDLGNMFPYFSLSATSQFQQQKNLELINFISMTNPPSFQHQFSTSSTTPTSSSSLSLSTNNTSSNNSNQLSLTKSIEQFVLNNLCMILKFISLAFNNYQLHHPSTDGKFVFDINSTRTQWILQMLIQTTSSSTNLRIKADQRYSLTSIIQQQFHDSSDQNDNESLPPLDSRSESQLSLSSATYSVDTTYQSQTDTIFSSTQSTTSSPTLQSQVQPLPRLSPSFDSNLVLDLECSYLLSYVLQLTHATISTYIHSQLFLTSPDSNPYLSNIIAHLQAGLPVDFDQYKFIMIDPDIITQFLTVNHHSSALLPVTFYQVKKILSSHVTLESLHADVYQRSFVSTMDSECDSTNDFYNNKFGQIYTLLQQSHSTTTKSSTANKSISQSHITSSSQYIIVSDFFAQSLEMILRTSTQTSNTLVQWFDWMSSSPITASNVQSLSHSPQQTWLSTFISLFSPSLFINILPQHLILITTGQNSSPSTQRQHDIATPLSSLPLTSISSATSPSQSLLTLTFDAVISTYLSGLAHEIVSSPTLLPRYLTTDYKLSLDLSNPMLPSPLFPTRTKDLLHFFVSYLLCTTTLLSQWTHQYTLVAGGTTMSQLSTPSSSIATLPIIIPNYTHTLLSMLCASISKLLCVYTLTNSILSYLVLQSLSISTLSSLSTLSTTNPHLTTLITMVMTSSSNRQLSILHTEGFDPSDSKLQVVYQNIKTATDYPLDYELPQSLLGSASQLPLSSQLLSSSSTTMSTTATTQSFIPPSQLIIPQHQLGTITSVNCCDTYQKPFLLSPIVNDAEILHEFVGPYWIHTLLQYFHHQIVPSDLRLCSESLFDEDDVNSQVSTPKPLSQQSIQSLNNNGEKHHQQEPPQPAATPLDMLIRYNVISPYLDSLYGISSTTSILPEHSQFEKDYATHVHLNPRQNVSLQQHRVHKLQHMIDILSLLTYIARIAPNLALFILKYCPSEQRSNTTHQSQSNEVVEETIDDNVVHKVSNSNDFCQTFPLLATLLFFATSLSLEFDSAELAAQFKQQQSDFTPTQPGDEQAINNDEQHFTYHTYQLTLTKNLATQIFAQLTQDITIKTLIVAHGIDIYSLLVSPDEYLIQYGPDINALEHQQPHHFPSETFPPCLIPRTSLSETMSKQILHTNLLLSLPQLCPKASYQLSPSIIGRTSIQEFESNSFRFDAFSHLWNSNDMLIQPQQASFKLPQQFKSVHPYRTIYSASFPTTALYSIGVLVASQSISINKHDSELLLETSTQLLAQAWHQLEYLSKFDSLFLQNIDQWYVRHYTALSQHESNKQQTNCITSKSFTTTPVTSSKLNGKLFPHTSFGQLLLSLVLNSVSELTRAVVESLMYLCVDYKIKQATVKHKLFYILHAFCGCISAHHPVPTVSDWKQSTEALYEMQQQLPDLKPHHITVQFKNTIPTGIDLFALVHSPATTTTATTSIHNELHVSTVKSINTYLGEHLLKDTAIRLAILQILHHLALSKDDIKKDEEQSQTSEQVAALKAAASRGLKSAAQGGKSNENQKDISELYGTAQEMMPIQLLTTPYVIDCLYQIKCAYQYAYVCGLPQNVRALVETNLSKSTTTIANNSTSPQTNTLLTLSAKYSNNLLLPIPVMMMLMQIIKTYTSLKLPNDAMSKRFKSQLIWCFNIPSIILDIHSQLSVLLKEMQRRDLEKSEDSNGPLQLQKTIYPQRYYYPRKDFTSTTLSDSELSASQNAAPVLTTEQVINFAQVIDLWCSLSLSRITIHTNPHILKKEHFHRIFPILIECALSEQTTHELTIYESLLASTNLLARRQEEEYNYCVNNNIVNRCLNHLLLGSVTTQFNFDIITATVEMFCNMCSLGVIDHFLNTTIPSLDVLKNSAQKDQSTSTTTINNQGVLLLRVLMQYATYDDSTEKNVYSKTAQGIVESASTTTTSLMRLKCPALGCLAMICGSSPFLAACVAQTTISTSPSTNDSSTSTTHTGIFAPVALMALLQAPVQSPEHEQGVPDPSNGIILGFKDIRVRCRAALHHIQQVIPLVAQNKELSHDSW